MEFQMNATRWSTKSKAWHIFKLSAFSVATHNPIQAEPTHHHLQNPMLDNNNNLGWMHFRGCVFEWLSAQLKCSNCWSISVLSKMYIFVHLMLIARCLLALYFVCVPVTVNHAHGFNCTIRPTAWNAFIIGESSHFSGWVCVWAVFILWFGWR